MTTAEIPDKLKINVTAIIAIVIATFALGKVYFDNNHRWDNQMLYNAQTSAAIERSNVMMDRIVQTQNMLARADAAVEAKVFNAIPSTSVPIINEGK
jgi:hypothetical protein